MHDKTNKTPSQNTEDNSKITRRRALVILTAGIVANGLTVSYLWLRSRKKQIHIVVDGPFSKGAWNSRDLKLNVENGEPWFSVEELSMAFSDFEPAAVLTLLLHPENNLPNTSFRIDGRIIGRSEKVLASASESYDFSKLTPKARQINFGVTTAVVIPTIEHSIPWGSGVDLADMTKVQWQILFA